jgi:hypothetical protein
MKVKDLIEKLQRVNPEIEVYASPSIYLEHRELGIQQATEEKSYKRTADPTKKYPVESIAWSRSAPGFPVWEGIILVYDDTWAEEVDES